MKLYKLIEIYLKYDNIHTNVIINVFICINNHVNSCTNFMLSMLEGTLVLAGRVEENIDIVRI